MPADSPLTPPPNGEVKSDPGLPTVTPPTGSMFFRLFGVPALIVGGLVLVLIVGQPLLGKFSKYFLGRAWGSASPSQFLRDLDNTNKEVRWRAANDLAQVLLRDDNLASDSAFALQLTQRLRRTLDSSAPFEKIYAEHAAKLSPDEETRERTKLEPDRDYIVLLAQCLSRFMVPVGAPILEELAVQQSGLDPRALSARRRQALWALANLGENVKRFDNLSAEQQAAVLSQLETAAGDGEQASAAKKTFDYLKRRQEGRPNALGVDQVIEKCADAEDPSLRELAAFVANFWSGTPAENQRIEKTLLRLCDDPGRGEDALAKLEDENTEQETRKLVKKPGFRVQVNAAIALARQGWKVRLTLLQTLLDEEELRGIFVVQSKNGGAERPDQAVVVETMLNALKAVAELHHKNPQLDLSPLRPNLDKLAHNPNAAVQTEAGRVVLALSDSQGRGQQSEPRP
jgi:hypothetical protein